MKRKELTKTFIMIFGLYDLYKKYLGALRVKLKVFSFCWILLLSLEIISSNVSLCVFLREGCLKG